MGSQTISSLEYSVNGAKFISGKNIFDKIFYIYIILYTKLYGRTMQCINGASLKELWAIRMKESLKKYITI